MFSHVQSRWVFEASIPYTELPRLIGWFRDKGDFARDNASFYGTYNLPMTTIDVEVNIYDKSLAMEFKLAWGGNL